jgi:hypothetical protein
MNLAQLRTKTRRLVNETSAGNWADADVDAEINNALHEAEAVVSLVAPHEFLEEAVIDTDDGVAAVTGGTWYLRPTYEPLKVVRLKTDATSAYKDLDKLTIDQVYDHVGGSVAQSGTREGYGYALRGKYMLIRPAPPAGVTAGILCLYYDKLALSADADTPRLPLALHHRIAYRAATLLLQDSKDAADDVIDRLMAEWAYYFGPDESARRRLYREHYFDRQATKFTPGVEWAS